MALQDPIKSGSGKRKVTGIPDTRRTKVQRTKLDPTPKATSARPAPKKQQVKGPDAAAASAHLGPDVVAINRGSKTPISLFVFGTGDGGELGLGPKKSASTKPRSNDMLAPADSNKPSLVQFSCGGMHTVALTADNKIITWGVNDNGALGRETAWEAPTREMDDEDSDEDQQELNPFESTPTEISQDCFPAGVNFTQVAAGDSCSFALTNTGDVYGWGCFRDPEGKNSFVYDDSGELIEIQRRPVQIASLKKITQLACGANHALALDIDGQIWGWGSGHQNQLGKRLFGRNSDSLRPRRIELFRQKAKYVASGEHHALAIDTKDNVWAWGLNNYGQAGHANSAGTDMALLPYPMKVKDLCGKNITVLAGGAFHSVAVSDEGKCFAWGRVESGQLGLTLDPSLLDDPDWIRCDERKKPRICLRPTNVTGIENVTDVACGTEHTIFVTKAGLAYSTGYGPLGQLGLGSEEEEVDTPREVKSLHIDNQKLCMAGAGGQFSIIASLVGAGVSK